MKLINSDGGVIVVGDIWDYKLLKADMAWELALRVMPEGPRTTGRWTEEHYLENAQKVLEQSHGIIDAVFKADEASGKVKVSSY